MTRQATYRQTPTPGGLKAIEKGTLNYFDTEMYGNFNTGVLEEYLEEKTRREGFRISIWPWKKVVFGIMFGAAMAVVIEFVGLKVGLVISGTWYMVYVIGLWRRWNASDQNIVTSAVTTAAHMTTGFVFTFPAMYLLALNPNYFVNGQPIIRTIPSIVVPVVAACFAGLLGTVFFIIFRRLWLIDDPLPVPGFEPGIKLLEISDRLARRAAAAAQRSVRAMIIWTGLTCVFVALRDYPVQVVTDAAGRKEHYALLDLPFKGNPNWGLAGIMQQPVTSKFTWVAFQFEPILIALGWFMKARIAFLFSAGSMLTWFVIIPLAVSFQTPVFLPQLGQFINVADHPTPALRAYSSIARPMAIGAILGGGITALVRMYPAFKRIGGDIANALKGTKGAEMDYLPGRGWYDWPIIHIPIIGLVTLVGVSVVFIAGGYPPLHSILFAVVLVVTAFGIGAIAVKVMGEIGTEPVSGTSFIVLIMLIGIFQGLDTFFTGQVNVERTAIMAILGTTTFAAAITMSGNIVSDFKAALYIGNRPYHMMNSVLWAVIPGAITAVIGAVFLSRALATGEIDLPAPQANAFATIVQMLLGGTATQQILEYFAIGFIIGVSIDILTGMGTAFGLGMYFPLYLTLPVFFSGLARDVWQHYRLELPARRQKWDDVTKTLVLLDSYMAAAGLYVGGAVAGTVVAVVLVFS